MRFVLQQLLVRGAVCTTTVTGSNPGFVIFILKLKVQFQTFSNLTVSVRDSII